MNLTQTLGKLGSYHRYDNPKIKEVLKENNIHSASDLFPERIQVFSEEIVQKLFVRHILDKAVGDHGVIREGKDKTKHPEPDFIIEKNQKAAITVEVYTPVFTEKLLERSRELKKGEFLESRSGLHPLETDMIKGKLTKYREKYPDAKHCLFLFFSEYLSEKSFMRAFYNFYGDTLHSNGVLAHHSKNQPFCAREDMEKVAGIFIVEGHLNFRESCLEYSDIIFMHNPFCLEEYRISLCDFNSEHIFESYVQFLDSRPTREDPWGHFLIRFQGNRYPEHIFLENDINYCRQKYPYIIRNLSTKTDGYKR